MEKQRKWQLFLILSVIALTIYNILPTVFYYTKPLKEPINPKQAEELAVQIEKRVNALETESKEWLTSFCDLIQVKPLTIALDSQNPQLIAVSFSKNEEAARFRKFLPQAGAHIPFVPAQLTLAAAGGEEGKEVLVQRRIPIHFGGKEKWFSFAPKNSSEYKEIILDRAAELALALAGPSESAQWLSSGNPQVLPAVAAQINRIAGLKGAVATRATAGILQGPFSNRSEVLKNTIAAFDSLRDEMKQSKDPSLEKKELELFSASSFLKKQESLITSGEEPLTLNQIKTLFATRDELALGKRNPLFSEVKIDWEKSEIQLRLHPDVSSTDNEQLLIDEIARVTQWTGEKVSPEFTIAFHTLPNTSGLLSLDLEKMRNAQLQQVREAIQTSWHPQHPDLQNIPLVDSADYQTLPPESQALSLILSSTPGLGTPNHSFYLIAKGIGQVFASYEAFPESELAQTLARDFRALAGILQQHGFTGQRAPGNDFIFERRDFIPIALAATRENFAVKGTQKYATLELSNLEQRLLATNQIETSIHEGILRWRDEYNTAQVTLNPATRYDVPKPTKSVFWSNLSLSLNKLIRGDEKKVIRWGLDLSGGKTVQIELRDNHNRVVTDDASIKQGINELYNRVNKMGVSEVAIRQLGNHITLDFPGSQSLSASELIKASSMYFHLVNEKFSINNPLLAESVNRFTQEVWNEAVVKNRKDAQNLNAIAWRHLHAENPTEAARTLLENGLTLSSPDDPEVSSAIGDESCKIALIRSTEYKDWFGQTTPLLIVFRNFALEGSQLDHVHASYDPSKGNYLSFEVRSGSREPFQEWTSRYCKDAVKDSPLGSYSRGRGWRMAVLLNDTLISVPTLESALRDSAMISGSFSQREVNQLAADLKAGSLTFTPHILSEKNVSPELGQKDRVQGITATIVALLLVIVSMIVYYRFAGLVASVAVIFNLLILWAVLQNMGATLSLAGIAGVILTVGMAVDANVLVFERIKEEFAISGRISSAIAIGYKKAYSAIIDSNVTTIIAALILLNFDAGPIKGFAITLIIGIVSSMFTALFMTRYYFASWLQNPNHKSLSMANWIRPTKINFLKYRKLSLFIAAATIAVGSYFVYAERATIFGMDFTGGYSLTLDLEPIAEKNYTQRMEEALIAKGASSRDFQVRELNPANQVRVLFSTSMEQPGKPFAAMPLVNEAGKNPRIEWIAESLREANLAISPANLATLDANWTAMSGQMSDSMRNNALIGLLISFLCIFIYIAFRFEYKFAAASILCLLHDVLITLGVMGLLHKLGVPVQIDLNTVAAIMTIVGYSLNDTIIIFDRIREEMHLYPKRRLSETVNSALNATLSRTTITSGTTLIVLIALVALGGSSIFSFALVMTIGVFFGTLSSWYIASPLMLFFHTKEEKNERETTLILTGD